MDVELAPERDLGSERLEKGRLVDGIRPCRASQLETNPDFKGSRGPCLVSRPVETGGWASGRSPSTLYRQDLGERNEG